MVEETAEERVARLVSEGKYPDFRPPSGVEKSVRVECYVNGLTVADSMASIREIAALYDRQTAALGSGGQQYSGPHIEAEQLLELLKGNSKTATAAMFRAAECGLNDKQLERLIDTLDDEINAYHAPPRSGEIVRLASAVSRRLFAIEGTPPMARHTIPRERVT